MSITATVKNYIHFEGDQESEIILGSGPLINSADVQQLVTLLNGDNTITIPVVVGFVIHGVAIIPPHANVVEPILKGDLGDVGITISASQASVIQFGATVPAAIYFEVPADIIGLRLVWF